MQVIVDKHTVTIQKNEIVNEGEYNVQSCNFQFSSDYDGLPKVAIFKTDTVTKQIMLSGNSCITPEEVLQTTGIVGLGVYAYETDGDNLTLRYSPTPAVFTVEPGSYDEGDTPTPPTPSIVEQLQTQITENANNISSLQDVTSTHTTQIENLQSDVSDIKSEQTIQNGNIQANTNDISDIKAEQITQNGNIQTNANDISDIKAEQITQNQSIIQLQEDLSSETLNRQNADNNLQSQIDAITVSSDVIDVLGTYQDLQNYDTQHVKANDIIKILQDSTHSNSMSYYRWVITDHVGGWVYVGSEGPYYTKSEADVLLQGKADVDDVYTKSETYSKSETDTLLNGKQNTLTFDTTPTENSTNPVTSGGMYNSQEAQNTQISALNNLVDQLPVVSGTGTNISLENVLNYRFRKLDIFGNISQNGEPAPDSPIPIKVVTGENNLNIMNKNQFSGVFRQGTNSNLTVTSRIYCDSNVWVEKGKTYVFSTNMNTSLFKFGVNLCSSKLPSSSMVFDSGWKSQASYSFTPNTSGYLGVAFAKIDNSDLTPSAVSGVQFQFEEGSTATPYVEHQEQNYTLNLGSLELAKIGDYQDYLYKSGDNWYKKQVVGKITLNGSENWSSASSVVSGTSRFYYDNANCLNNNVGSAVNIVSDKFKAISWQQIYADDTTTKNAIALWASDELAGRIVIRIDNTLANSVANFKAWLSSNNVTAYFVQATSTDIQITDTTLINQLNNIYNNAYSYNGVTNISSSCASGNEQMIFEASALLDLNSLVTRIQLIESEV